MSAEVIAPLTFVDRFKETVAFKKYLREFGDQILPPLEFLIDILSRTLKEVVPVVDLENLPTSKYPEVRDIQAHGIRIPKDLLQVILAEFMVEFPNLVHGLNGINAAITDAVMNDFITSSQLVLPSDNRLAESPMIQGMVNKLVDLIGHAVVEELEHSIESEIQQKLLDAQVVDPKGIHLKGITMEIVNLLVSGEYWDNLDLSGLASQEDIQEMRKLTSRGMHTDWFSKGLQGKLRLL
jgi:hypothetical protein